MQVNRKWFMHQTAVPAIPLARMCSRQNSLRRGNCLRLYNMMSEQVVSDTVSDVLMLFVYCTHQGCGWWENFVDKDEYSLLWGQFDAFPYHVDKLAYS